VSGKKERKGPAYLLLGLLEILDLLLLAGELLLQLLDLLLLLLTTNNRSFERNELAPFSM
jgi:hypothetical protein